MKEKKPLKKDDSAVVLDFLSHGHHGMDRSQPVAQVVGNQYFSLLELIIRDDVKLTIGDSIYIGDGKRDVVKYIRGRIKLDDLTVAAKEELPDIIDDIIKKNPRQHNHEAPPAGAPTRRGKEAPLGDNRREEIQAL
jgi:putative nucleotide binding protein